MINIDKIQNEVNLFFDPQCIPCIINQAYKAAQLFTNGNKELQFNILKEACSEVETINGEYSAPLFSAKIQSILEKNLKLTNPYKSIKDKNLENAKIFLPVFNYIYKSSKDRLEAAVKIAVLGNTIDMGANPDFDLEDEVNKLSSGEINLRDFKKFKEDLSSASSVLYIGDNYEEALFDKYLLELMKDKNLVFAVRSHPVLNDITLEDAERLGINKICRVIESGSKIAGTDIRNCSNEFMEIYNNADMVIAKGQGNYETLLDEKRSIYFLFKVKCDVIARRSGLSVGQSVLHYKN